MLSPNYYQAQDQMLSTTRILDFSQRYQYQLGQRNLTLTARRSKSFFGTNQHGTHTTTHSKAPPTLTPIGKKHEGRLVLPKVKTSPCYMLSTKTAFLSMDSRLPRCEKLHVRFGSNFARLVCSQRAGLLMHHSLHPMDLNARCRRVSKNFGCAKMDGKLIRSRSTTIPPGE